MKIVATSGGFDPLHVGHIRLFKEARKLGDKLIVILNTDEFLKKKKGFCFMSYEERKETIRAIKYVDEVYRCRDTDQSVCKTLRLIKPDIFAKGGDRTLGNIPERAVCEELGIEMKFGVGGGKIQSSSWLLGEFKSKDLNKINKPWGNFQILYQEPTITIKILTVKAGHRLSLQTHQKRDEFWLVIEGDPSMQLGHVLIKMESSKFYPIPKIVPHRLIANKKDCRVLEVSYGEFDEEDVIRHEDDYGRI